MITILDPVAAARDNSGASAPLVASVTGLTVGILTNHWKSMDRMAARMAARLKERHGALDVRLYDIPINGAMKESVKHAVITECQAAIVGLAN
jgi:hypothetical protein